jgi:hypothetical protein
MRAAYLDTSVLVAPAFGEPAGKAVAHKLTREATLPAVVETSPWTF